LPIIGKPCIWFGCPMPMTAPEGPGWWRRSLRADGHWLRD